MQVSVGWKAKELSLKKKEVFFWQEKMCLNSYEYSLEFAVASVSFQCRLFQVPFPSQTTSKAAPPIKEVG